MVEQLPNFLRYVINLCFQPLDIFFILLDTHHKPLRGRTYIRTDTGSKRLFEFT